MDNDHTNAQDFNGMKICITPSFEQRTDGLYQVKTTEVLDITNNVWVVAKVEAQKSGLAVDQIAQNLADTKTKALEQQQAAIAILDQQIAAVQALVPSDDAPAQEADPA